MNIADQLPSNTKRWMTLTGSAYQHPDTDTPLQVMYHAYCKRCSEKVSTTTKQPVVSFEEEHRVCQRAKRLLY